MSSERLSQIYKHPNDPNASKVETAKSRAQRRNLGEDELTFQPKVNASSEVLAKDWISQPLEHRLFYAEQVKQKQKEQVRLYCPFYSAKVFFFYSYVFFVSDLLFYTTSQESLFHPFLSPAATEIRSYEAGNGGVYLPPCPEPHEA